MMVILEKSVDIANIHELRPTFGGGEGSLGNCDSTYIMYSRIVK